MALDYGTNPTFAGRITPPDVNYPQGSSKDETGPGANDGMPYNKQRADDVLGYQQALLLEGNVSPNGSSDTAINSQYMLAAKRIFKSGRKNLLDNGQFIVWQQGTSFSVPANILDYTADRFQVYSDNGSIQVDQVSNTQFPSYVNDVKFGIRLRPGAGSTRLGMIQKIESNDSYHVSGNSITASFIINSNENTNIDVYIQSPDSIDNWLTATDLDTVNVPISVGDNKVEVTFNNVDSSVVRGLSLVIECNSFTAGSFDASITLTQLEVGTVATNFEYINIFEDSARCQRYFYSSYDPGITPGTPYANRSPLFYPQSASTDLFGTHTFSQGMRVRPSITIFRPSTGTIGEVERENETFPLQVASVEFSVFGLFGIILTSAPAVDIYYQFHLTADARL